MIRALLMLLALAPLFAAHGVWAEDLPDETRDILVTFDNSTASTGSAGLRAPYRNRKRYSVANSVRKHAKNIAREFDLVEVDHWPIRSLSVYCYVFRIAEGGDRNDLIARLEADERVESAQPMNLFDATLETANDSRALDYDDTYANLQHGLTSLQLHEAHRASTGRGVRVAIVDSDTDVDHEDLSGRIGRHEVFADKLATLDSHHGTAVASVIGARSNNARGMVGVAPAATLEIFVSCWRSARNKAAICDSFTLLKAIDAVLEDPPHVLNLSLTGPEDALLRRVLERAIDAGVIVVAACPLDTPPAQRFPATMQNVIAVGRADAPSIDAALAGSLVFAPGDEILVATPGDGYDFRSGSSLSAAHVSGIVALMLEASPTLSPDTVFAALLEAKHDGGPHASVSACRALQQVSHVQCPVPTAFD